MSVQMSEVVIESPFDRRRTLELTEREKLYQASNLANEKQAISAPVE